MARKSSIDPCGPPTYGPPALVGARSSAAEHLTFNQRVDGSIPSGLTKRNETTAELGRLAISAGFCRRLGLILLR